MLCAACVTVQEWATEDLEEISPSVIPKATKIFVNGMAFYGPVFFGIPNSPGQLFAVPLITLFVCGLHSFQACGWASTATRRRWWRRCAQCGGRLTSALRSALCTIFGCRWADNQPVWVECTRLTGYFGFDVGAQLYFATPKVTSCNARCRSCGCTPTMGAAAGRCSLWRTRPSRSVKVGGRMHLQ